MTVKACRYFQQVCADVRKVPGSGGGGGCPLFLVEGFCSKWGLSQWWPLGVFQINKTHASRRTDAVGPGRVLRNIVRSRFKLASSNSIPCTEGQVEQGLSLQQSKTYIELNWLDQELRSKLE